MSNKGKRRKKLALEEEILLAKTKEIELEIKAKIDKEFEELKKDLEKKEKERQEEQNSLELESKERDKKQLQLEEEELRLKQEKEERRKNQIVKRKLQKQVKTAMLIEQHRRQLRGTQATRSMSIARATRKIESSAKHGNLSGLSAGQIRAQVQRNKRNIALQMQRLAKLKIAQAARNLGTMDMPNIPAKFLTPALRAELARLRVRKTNYVLEAARLHKRAQFFASLKGRSISSIGILNLSSLHLQQMPDIESSVKEWLYEQMDHSYTWQKRIGIYFDRINVGRETAKGRWRSVVQPF